jgi:hypothetical protein
MLKKIVAPLNKSKLRDPCLLISQTRGTSRRTHGVYGIDALSALIALSTHPVLIQIGEYPINVIRACRVSIPFAGMIFQEELVL